MPESRWTLLQSGRPPARIEPLVDRHGGSRRLTKEFTATERMAFGIVAAIGALGLNGVFLYALLVNPSLIGAAFTNPVSIAFVLGAFVMLGLLAYVLDRWEVSRLTWLGFVILALLGGLAFAFPVALLWRREAPLVASVLRMTL